MRQHSNAGRRDSISGAFTGTSDKSSGAKSISTASTLQADNMVESRHSLSLPTECRSAEFSPGATQHQEINGDAFLQHESPLVSIHFPFVFLSIHDTYMNKLDHTVHAANAYTTIK
ncbi:hypothetical protein Hanom_Chr02g00167691 [Helianthus anomalus]